MTDDSRISSRRRGVLSAMGAAGVSSLAGCSWLDQQESSPTDDGDGTPTDQSPPPQSSGPLEGIGGYRVASSFAESGSGTPADPWQLGEETIQEPGRVFFDAGTFNPPSDGLRTSSDVDYERWSVSLQGAGVRTTQLRKPPNLDKNLLSFRSDDFGNFGGAHDMALYGTHPGGEEQYGHLLYSNGSIIDLLFSNLIVRYGWQDGIRIEASSSGTRIRNCWVENNGGWAINMGGGTRAKLSDLHIISSAAGGIDLGANESQVSNTTFNNCSPGLVMNSNDSQVANCYFVRSDEGVAIREPEDAFSNSFANIAIKDSIVGVDAAAPDSDYANISIDHSTSEAMKLRGDGITVTGLGIVDVGSSGRPALRIDGNDVRVTGVSVDQQNDPFLDDNTLARITGDGVVLSDVDARGGGWGVVLDGATETVLDNVRGLSPGEVIDGGTRTLINGAGTNDGSPGSGGEWNGHADYAYAMGATVWDTTTSPWTPYRADGDGNWLDG